MGNIMCTTAGVAVCRVQCAVVAVFVAHIAVRGRESAVCAATAKTRLVLTQHRLFTENTQHGTIEFDKRRIIFKEYLLYCHCSLNSVTFSFFTPFQTLNTC